MSSDGTFLINVPNSEEPQAFADFIHSALAAEAEKLWNEEVWEPLLRGDPSSDQKPVGILSAGVSGEAMMIEEIPTGKSPLAHPVHQLAYQDYLRRQLRAAAPKQKDTRKRHKSKRGAK